MEPKKRRRRTRQILIDAEIHAALRVPARDHRQNLKDMVETALYRTFFAPASELSRVTEPGELITSLNERDTWLEELHKRAAEREADPVEEAA